MSSLQAQIDARKRRLEGLRKKRSSGAADQQHESEHKRSKTDPEEPSFELLAQQTDTFPPSDENYGVRLETSSSKLGKPTLGKLKNTDDGTAAEEDDNNVPRNSQLKHHGGTDAMRAEIDRGLEELERRTNDQIKRIVRREFMQDAVTRNG